MEEHKKWADASIIFKYLVDNTSLGLKEGGGMLNVLNDAETSFVADWWLQ